MLLSFLSCWGGTLHLSNLLPCYCAGFQKTRCVFHLHKQDEQLPDCIAKQTRYPLAAHANRTAPYQKSLSFFCANHCKRSSQVILPPRRKYMPYAPKVSQRNIAACGIPFPETVLTTCSQEKVCNKTTLECVFTLSKPYRLSRRKPNLHSVVFPSVLLIPEIHFRYSAFVFSLQLIQI